MKNIKFLKNRSIFFLGIGGISMSAIAEFCLKKGMKVSGSDKNDNSVIKRLVSLGASVFIGHNPDNVPDCDYAVYTSAISPDNVELKVIREKNIPLYKRSEILGQIISEYKKSICVSGSHGKTTATAMIAEISRSAHKSPTVFLGGEDKEFGNFSLGDSDFVIAEACEYKKNFLDIKPYLSVVLNIDNDHLDSFGSIEHEKSAFNEFVKNTVSVVNADDVNSKDLNNPCSISFGIYNPAMFKAEGIKFNGKGYSFNLISYGLKQGRINLKICGKHNVYNALSAVAVADFYCIPFSVIKSALENFEGVLRRNEFIGKIHGVSSYADYAHHPTEISAMLHGYEKCLHNTLIVFQPHTFSRTKLLLNDFVKELNRAKLLIIYKTFPARESFDEFGSAEYLFKCLNNNRDNVWFADSPQKLSDLILALKYSFQRILFLGAGDIYDIAKSLTD